MPTIHLTRYASRIRHCEKRCAESPALGRNAAISILNPRLPREIVKRYLIGVNSPSVGLTMPTNFPVILNEVKDLAIELNKPLIPSFLRRQESIFDFYIVFLHFKP